MTDLDLLAGLEALKECVRPLVISLPDTQAQVCIRRVLGDDGLVQTLVDLRPRPEGVWCPIQLCGGTFEVRDE